MRGHWKIYGPSIFTGTLHGVAFEGGFAYVNWETLGEEGTRAALDRIGTDPRGFRIVEIPEKDYPHGSKDPGAEFTTEQAELRDWLTQLQRLRLLVDRAKQAADIHFHQQEGWQAMEPARLAAREAREAAAQIHDHQVQRLLYGLDDEEREEFVRLINLEPPAFEHTLQIKELIPWLIVNRYSHTTETELGS